jgi:hypothetical protein
VPAEVVAVLALIPSPTAVQLNAEPDVDPRRERPKFATLRRAGPRRLA